MTNPHAMDHSHVETGNRAAERTLAIGLGVVLMAVGLGMGVAKVVPPMGWPLGLVGLLIGLWGVFYATPAAPSQPHGHGPSAH